MLQCETALERSGQTMPCPIGAYILRRIMAEGPGLSIGVCTLRWARCFRGLKGPLGVSVRCEKGNTANQRRQTAPAVYSDLMPSGVLT